MGTSFSRCPAGETDLREHDSPVCQLPERIPAVYRLFAEPGQLQPFPETDAEL